MKYRIKIDDGSSYASFLSADGWQHRDDRALTFDTQDAAREALLAACVIEPVPEDEAGD